MSSFDRSCESIVCVRVCVCAIWFGWVCFCVCGLGWFFVFGCVLGCGSVWFCVRLVCEVAGFLLGSLSSGETARIRAIFPLGNRFLILIP